MDSVSGTASALPADIREMAEFAVDDVDTLSHAWLDTEREGLATLERQARVIRASTMAVAKKLLAASATNAESSLEFARDLIAAGSFAEMVRIEFAFFEDQTRAILRQTEDLSRTMIHATGLLAKL